MLSDHIAYGEELLLNLLVVKECQNNSDLCPCIKPDDDCGTLGMVNNEYIFHSCMNPIQLQPRSLL